MSASVIVPEGPGADAAAARHEKVGWMKPSLCTSILAPIRISPLQPRQVMPAERAIWVEPAPEARRDRPLLTAGGGTTSRARLSPARPCVWPQYW